MSDYRRGPTLDLLWWTNLAPCITPWRAACTDLAERRRSWTRNSRNSKTSCRGQIQIMSDGGKLQSTPSPRCRSDLKTAPIFPSSAPLSGLHLKNSAVVNCEDNTTAVLLTGNVQPAQHASQSVVIIQHCALCDRVLLLTEEPGKGEER